MKSIFMTMDKRFSKAKFWTSCYQIDSRIIFEKEIIEAVDLQRPSLIRLVLTQDYIYRHQNEKPLKRCNIKWKLIEPFIIQSPEAVKYGFRIRQGSLFSDFYVEDSVTLDVWISQLSAVAISLSVEDSYKFIKEIGRGSFATIYLATDKNTGEKYAIKSCSKVVNFSSQKDFTQIFNEISMMRDLKHPNILNLHKVYESETHVHLILDYIRGKNLYERLLRRQKYTEELAADFTLKLLNVLDYIHSQNVVHRDIKLTNILMVSKDSDTDFKLADFGLSCEDNGHLSLRCGSPGYFAPEILRRKEYGKKVDLFSTGIVLYNMLSGQVAFCAKGPHEMLMKNMDARISWDSPVWEGISKEAISLLMNLTSSEANQRMTANEAAQHPWFNLKINNNRKTKSRSKRVYLALKEAVVKEQDI